MLENDKRGRTPSDPRVEEALRKIEDAQRHLKGAAENLSRASGFAEEWSLTLELYETIKQHWHRVAARRGELERSRLVLTEEGGGPRYLLAGRPVNAGDTIEFDDGDGWISARFEWSHRLDDVPELHLADGTIRPLPNEALFRWPGDL